MLIAVRLECSSIVKLMPYNVWWCFNKRRAFRHEVEPTCLGLFRGTHHDASHTPTSYHIEDAKFRLQTLHPEGFHFCTELLLLLGQNVHHRHEWAPMGVLTDKEKAETLSVPRLHRLRKLKYVDAVQVDSRERNPRS